MRASEFNTDKNELHYVTLYTDIGTLISPTLTKNSCPSVTSVYTKVSKISEMAIQNTTSVSFRTRITTLCRRTGYKLRSYFSATQS